MIDKTPVIVEMVSVVLIVGGASDAGATASCTHENIATIDGDSA